MQDFRQQLSHMRSALKPHVSEAVKGGVDIFEEIYKRKNFDY